MSDATLLVFVCAVTFLAAGGAYIYLRARFDESVRHYQRQAVRAVETDPAQKDAA